MAQRTPTDEEGDKVFKVSIVATPRRATGPCIERYERSHGGIRYGRYLEIQSVNEVRPLGCSYMAYVWNSLSGPVRPGSIRVDRRG